MVLVTAVFATVWDTALTFGAPDAVEVETAPDVAVQESSFARPVVAWEHAGSAMTAGGVRLVAVMGIADVELVNGQGVIPGRL